MSETRKDPDYGWAVYDKFHWDERVSVVFDSRTLATEKMREWQKERASYSKCKLYLRRVQIVPVTTARSKKR